MTKISERVSRIFYSKHLFVYRVTFLSPLKQMGLVSYNYHLVAKSQPYPFDWLLYHLNPDILSLSDKETL
jgi:hypothetical protein